MLRQWIARVYRALVKRSRRGRGRGRKKSLDRIVYVDNAETRARTHRRGSARPGISGMDHILEERGEDDVEKEIFAGAKTEKEDRFLSSFPSMHPFSPLFLFPSHPPCLPKSARHVRRTLPSICRGVSDIVAFIISEFSPLHHSPLVPLTTLLFYSLSL